MFLSSIATLFYNLFKVGIEFAGDLQAAKNVTSKPYAIAIAKCTGKIKKPARELRYMIHSANRSFTKPRHWKDKLPL